MQIAIFACFSLICYILAFAFRKSSPLVTHLLLGLSFVVLLLGGFYMIHELGGPLSVMLIYLSIISILLCISAFLFGFPYLLYCGVLALALVYGVATVDRVGDGYTWWRSELYWVPIMRSDGRIRLPRTPELPKMGRRFCDLRHDCFLWSRGAISLYSDSPAGSDPNAVVYQGISQLRFLLFYPRVLVSMASFIEGSCRGLFPFLRILATIDVEWSKSSG